MTDDNSTEAVVSTEAVGAYELSRAYAGGWTAAKKNFSDSAKGAVNPYADKTGAEFARWAAGYAEALASVASTKDARFD